MLIDENITTKPKIKNNHTYQNVNNSINYTDLKEFRNEMS